MFFSVRTWLRDGAPTNHDCLVQFSSVSLQQAPSGKGVESNSEVFLVVVVVVACDCVEGKGVGLGGVGRDGDVRVCGSGSGSWGGGPLRTGGFSLEI